MIIVYIWYVLSIPRDLDICTLWTQTLDKPALVSACGLSSFTEDYLYRVQDLYSGSLVCTRSATELPDSKCNLPGRLDSYRITIYRTNYQELLCSMSILNPGAPQDTDIESQCPDYLDLYKAGEVIIKLTGTQTKDTGIKLCTLPDLEQGPGLYDLPQGPEDLYSNQDLSLLAGDLIWYGLITPDCEGYSGLDPTTHLADNCGLRSARAMSIVWQNKLNQDIYNSGSSHKIPPRMIKALISVETQFIPIATGTQGEVGVIQITRTGADIALLYSQDLYNKFCPLAIFPGKCNEVPYAMLSDLERSQVQDALIASLYNSGDLLQSMEQVPTQIDTISLILGSYYCYTGELLGSPSWENTLIVYNSGGTCLEYSGLVCDDGQKYLDKIKEFNNG